MASFIDAIINRIKGPDGAGPGHPGQHGTQHHPETPLSQQRRASAHAPSSVPPHFSTQTHSLGTRVSSLPTATPASPPIRTPLDPYTPSGKNGVVFVPRRLHIDATPDLVNDTDYASASAKIPLVEDRSVSLSRSTRRSSVYHTADAGDDVDTSHSSVEITVGPQSVPFAVARRRPVSGADHLERIQERPASDGEDVYDTAHSHYQSAPSQVAAQEDAPLPVSSWRKEQLKYQKKARLSAETGPRPISAYHGPLSLPYARNPSGVDATISDDSAYLSNVFGLKAAPTIIPSGGTNRNVSTSSNSTTTSSIDYKRQMSTYRERANNALARSAMYQLTGQAIDPAVFASASQVNMVREPYQQIGIRKNSAEHPSNYKAVLNPKGLVYVPQQASTTVTIRAPDGSKPSATLRAQLHARSGSLEPILEPSEDPTTVIKRIARAPEFNGITYPLIPYGPDGQLTTHQEIQFRAAAAANSGTWPVLPPFSHIRVDSFGGVPRLVSDSSNSDSLTGPGTTRSSSNKSKADTSANWRLRQAGEESHIEGLKPAQDKGIMTMDTLFEKFGHLQTSEKPPATSAVQATLSPGGNSQPAPAAETLPSTVISPLGDKTHIVNAPATLPVDTPSKLPRSPVTVKLPTPATSVPISAASSTNKSPSRMAKGTPGAGKHLKKPSSTNGNRRPAMPKPVDGIKPTTIQGKDRAASSAKQ